MNKQPAFSEFVATKEHRRAKLNLSGKISGEKSTMSALRNLLNSYFITKDERYYNLYSQHKNFLM